MNMRKEIALCFALAFGSTFAIAGDKADHATEAAAMAATDQPTAQSLQWDKLDANKDGYLSKEEAKAGGLAMDFTAVDKNGDGRISKAEFAAIQGNAGAAGPTGPASTSGDKTQNHQY